MKTYDAKNKPRGRILALSFAVLALSLSGAFGQESGLSLEKAVEIALARNPDVLAARKAIDAARGRTLQLGARPSPQVALSAEGLPLPGLKKEGDEVEVNLGIEQIFEYPGKRSLRNELGRFGESLAEVEVERVRLLVGAEVKKAYWKTAFARRSVAALEKSAEMLDSLLANIQIKYQAGTAAYGDVLRTRAEKARLQNQILEAAKERETSRVALNVLLSRPAEEPLALLTDLAYAPLAKSLAALKEEARVVRPGFKISALRKNRAAAAVRLAGLNRRPDFVAGFLFPSIRPNGWGVSFGLTLPFLRTDRIKGEELEASAEEELVRLSAEALERRVGAALESSYAGAKAAEAQVQVFEKNLLQEMEGEIKITLDYYQYGKAEFTTLLDLYRAYVLTELEYLRALYLYLTAVADLEIAGEDSDLRRIP